MNHEMLKDLKVTRTATDLKVTVRDAKKRIVRGYVLTVITPTYGATKVGHQTRSKRHGKA